MEFYVTRGDDRYVPPPKFLVSNSTVMGEIKVTTRARDWTPEEIDRYGKLPPAYRSPNLHPPTLGEDVPSLNGWPWKNRYVEPEGRLLALEYHIVKWDKEADRQPGSDLQPRSASVEAIARTGSCGLRRGRRRG